MWKRKQLERPKSISVYKVGGRAHRQPEKKKGKKKRKRAEDTKSNTLKLRSHAQHHKSKEQPPLQITGMTKASNEDKVIHSNPRKKKRRNEKKRKENSSIFLIKGVEKPTFISRVSWLLLNMSSSILGNFVAVDNPPQSPRRNSTADQIDADKPCGQHVGQMVQ